MLNYMYQIIVIIDLFVFLASEQCIIHPLGARPPSPDIASCPAYSANHTVILVVGISF